MILPSASCVSPAQNKLSAGHTSVKLFAIGSESSAVEVWVEWSSALSHARTFPVGKRFKWTETRGQLTGLPHCPTTEGSVTACTNGSEPPALIAEIVVLGVRVRAGLGMAGFVAFGSVGFGVAAGAPR